MSAVAAVSVGSGYRRFLFSVGVLGMLDVEVRANSLAAAQDYIRSTDCIGDFPHPLCDEITGEEFTFKKEI